MDNISSKLNENEPRSCWLIAWNPDEWAWESFSDCCEGTKKGIPFKEEWRFRNQSSKIGDEVFLIKLGDKKPKGIIAHGKVASDNISKTDKNDKGETVSRNYVEIEFDKIQDYHNEPFIEQSTLKEDLTDEEDKQEWSPQSSGIRIKKRYVADLQKLWRDITENTNSSLNNDTSSNDAREEIKMTVNNPKNIILYGPPGTGKTYNTARYAIALCKQEKIEGLESDKIIDTEEYKKILKEYNDLKDEGRIVFTTFHQSYGYEEFIEGIRPLLDENDKKNLGYEVKPGIFKKFCDSALKPIQSVKENNNLKISQNPTVWVVLLDGAGKSKLKEYCFKNGEIRIGWGDCGEIITKETIGISNKERAILINFQDNMKIGDIVFVEKSRKTIDAIGIITGSSEFDKNGYKDFPRKRSVHWIKTDIDENVTDLNDGVQLDRKTVYPLPRYRIDLSEVFHLINKYVDEIVAVEETEEKKEPFVFIIDEINRGNISKIFGELITLIEPNKRFGADEEMSVTLPYSGETFSIPDNVYIIGTMNTADRSIALIDTALRRRFHFIEMMPNTEILKDGDENLKIRKETSGSVKEVDVKKMLDTMNERIECLYDREHTIGHGFFTSLTKEENRNFNNLKEIFKNKIIPLLQEYFYDDYKKIQMVLGDDDKGILEKNYKFIKEIPIKEELFKGSLDDFDIPQVRYEINQGAFGNIESYIKIYDKLNESNKPSEPSVADQTISQQ